MIQENWSKCVGCGCCVEVCPSTALTLIRNAKGFLAPLVDRNKCINCGLCERSCPVGGAHIKLIEPKHVYGAITKDKEILSGSSSGGFFSCVAKLFINNHGRVYGAVFNDEWEVEHVGCDDMPAVEKMRGSKYVQSNIRNTFKEIQKDLHEGRQVLFTGTPCQCAAILSYADLKNLPIDNLYTVEILCDGVNSPLIWNDYLRFITENGKIKNINFRDKSYGWKQKNMLIEYSRIQDGVHPSVSCIYSKKYSDDIFSQLFGGHYILRPSCYECSFARSERVADISMGDFWAYNRLPENMNVDNGVSLVLVNSTKGEWIFNQIKQGLSYCSSNMNDAKEKQGSLKIPPFKNKHTADFWSTYRKKGFIGACKKYTSYGIYGHLKKNLKQILNNRHMRGVEGK